MPHPQPMSFEVQNEKGHKKKRKTGKEKRRNWKKGKLKLKE
jgi:hypothetical protein